MRYVFYHKSCPDGFAAAWAAYQKFGTDGARYEPKAYGDPVGELEPNSEVYILDFSWPRDTLLDLANQGHKLVLLDHHKTAEENLRGLPFAVFDMNRSGAGLAWEYFHPGKPTPKLIECVEDNDLWRFRLEDTKRVKALLSTIRWSFESWDELAKRLESQLYVESADLILAYQNTFTRRQAQKAQLVDIGGYKVRCINAVTQISEICHQILEDFSETTFASSFFVEGNEFIYSLRGRGDFDVSTIAKSYGGGGHFSAAGFKADKMFPFIKVSRG